MAALLRLLGYLLLLANGFVLCAFALQNADYAQQINDLGSYLRENELYAYIGIFAASFFGSILVRAGLSSRPAAVESKS